MFGECRVPFKPNIFRVWHDSADLKQVWLINVAVFNDLIFFKCLTIKIWFEGVHADAWGPSILALNVLGYILHALRESNIHMDDNRLKTLLVGWSSAHHSLPGEHLGWWTSSPRCQLPVPSEYFQTAHWTLSNATEGNIMERVTQEDEILQTLKTVVNM